MAHIAAPLLFSFPYLQLNLIQEHKEALVDLVTITEKFRWESQVKGQLLIDTLMEEKNDLENLTVTLKTTSEMMLGNGMDGFYD